MPLSTVASMRAVYVANVCVAGWISFTSIISPVTATRTVFGDAFPTTETIRLVGSLWFAIFLLSALGLKWPHQMSPVLLLQLVYKATFLVCSTLPRVILGEKVPWGMSGFFLAWVVILPFVIPWKHLFFSVPKETVACTV
jgi:hypothetical protein